MYDWLPEAIESGATVITGNRRLARELTEHYNFRQLSLGRAAWQRPAILDLQAWLRQQLELSDTDGSSPMPLSSHQSRMLWENCLSSVLDENPANLPAIARMARETQGRLADSCVPADAVQRSASSDDQKLFSRAWSTYRHVKSERNWSDDSDHIERFLKASGGAELPKSMVFAGIYLRTRLFDRLVETLEQAGVRTRFIASDRHQSASALQFVTRDAELRAAGAWARERINADPGATVAIVVSRLDSDTEGSAARVREGFMPGWQLAEHAGSGAGVNVSLGRPLSAFPMISDALLALRAATATVTAAEFSVLLRSGWLSRHDDDSRLEAETLLRSIPDRAWTIELLAERLAACEGTSLHSLMDALASIHERLAGGRATPAAWAGRFDAALLALGWPGEASLSSEAFQVVNRWRELLNEFGRLGVISHAMLSRTAVSRLSGMALETVFQPEQQATAINVLGPLEALGLEFDALWIAGLDSATWPGPVRPTPLVASSLQREYAMQDSSPASSEKASRDLFRALRSQAARVVLSYARFEGEEEKTPSPMVSPLVAEDGDDGDPGWFAAGHADRAGLLDRIPETVPAVSQGERVWGGTSTLDAQKSNPFTAFMRGRLRASDFDPFSSGLSPMLRGNLVHDALKFLNRSAAGQASLKALSREELEALVADCVHRAMQREFVGADQVLRRLLQLEEARLRKLLLAVCESDLGRESFSIAESETEHLFHLKTMELKLRVDRVDQLADGSQVVFDYKTGAEKRFLKSGEPASLQLVLYSIVLNAPVSGLGLFNVDSRGISLRGVGHGMEHADSFDEELPRWQGLALAHLEDFVDGDVRIVAQLNQADSRPIALLSRIAELRHER